MSTDPRNSGPVAATWHLGAALAADYAQGRTGPVLAASVEQHLMRCGGCRMLLAPAVEPPRLDAVWAEVVERVEAPHLSVLERLLHRAGLDEGTARLVATTPSLRGSWLTGVVLVLTLALLTANASPGGITFFMLLAPVLPVAGVAFAFGPAADPAHEVTAATPHSSIHLLAVRTAFVVATTLVPAAVAAPYLPGTGWYALAWLLPALGMTLGTVALAMRFPPHLAAGSLVALWVALVIPALVHTRDPLLVSHPAVQLASFAALAVSAGALFLHRNDLPELLRSTS